MNRVDEKVAMITGGGSGIGKAVCEILAQAGAKVVVTDINAGFAEETMQTIVDTGGNAIAVQHDVASEQDWQRVMDITLEQFGELNVLVNNAGVGSPRGNCIETPLENLRKVLSINLEGTYLGVRSAITAMIANKEPGSIINIGSISALRGGNDTSYSASKGGITALTKATAIECCRQGYNIRVNALHPGDIDTPALLKILGEEGSKEFVTEIQKFIPLARMGNPMDIAKGVLFLASDDSSFITGTELVIDGGLSVCFNFGPQFNPLVETLS